ncbi:MAG: methyltransferase domain-containing protein [Candidatus Competibacter denitrificans]|jgi:hypothetical protein
MSLFILRRSGTAIAGWLERNITTSSATSSENPSEYLQKPILQFDNKTVAHDKTKATAQRQTRSIILDICRHHKVHHILTIGDDAQALCEDLHGTDYTVTKSRFNKQTPRSKDELFLLNLADKPEIPSHANRVSQISFDMAITIQSGESPHNPSELIRFIAEKLQPGGVLILTIPYLSCLKNLLIKLSKWQDLCRLTPSGRNHKKYYSKREVIKKLKLNGFENLELIGIRDASLRWQSLMFVARKTIN